MVGGVQGLAPSVLPLYSSFPFASSSVNRSLRPSSLASTAPVPAELMVMAHSCLMLLPVDSFTTVPALSRHR